MILYVSYLFYKFKIQKLYWSKLKTAHPNSPLLPAVLAARRGVLAIWSLNTYKYYYIGKMGKSKPTKELKGLVRGKGYLDKWKLRWRCERLKIP